MPSPVLMPASTSPMLEQMDSEAFELSSFTSPRAYIPPKLSGKEVPALAIDDRAHGRASPIYPPTSTLHLHRLTLHRRWAYLTFLIVAYTTAYLLFADLPAPLLFTVLLTPVFRAITLCLIGAVGWLAVFLYMHQCGTLPPSLTDYFASDSHRHTALHLLSTFRPIFSYLTAGIFAHAVTLYLQQHHAPVNTLLSRTTEALTLLTILHYVATSGSMRSLLAEYSILGHVLRPWRNALTRYPELLLADVLTSYARPLGDVFGFPFVLLDVASHTGSMIFKYYARLFSSIGTSVPAVIRLKQCLSDFIYAYLRHNATRDGPLNTLPLWNAAKYASGLPVIWLAYSAMAAGSDTGTWILAQTISSTFSLYWDLFNDWELGPWFGLMKNKIRGLHLGHDLAYPLWVYPVMIVLNTVARFTWLFRVPGGVASVGWFLDNAENIHSRTSVGDEWWVRSEGVAFAVLLIEVCRRMAWILLRSEKETRRYRAIPSRPRHVIER